MPPPRAFKHADLSVASRGANATRCRGVGVSMTREYPEPEIFFIYRTPLPTTVAHLWGSLEGRHFEAWNDRDVRGYTEAVVVFRPSTEGRYPAHLGYSHEQAIALRRFRRDEDGGGLIFSPTLGRR